MGRLLWALHDTVAAAHERYAFAPALAFSPLAVRAEEACADRQRIEDGDSPSERAVALVCGNADGRDAKMNNDYDSTAMAAHHGNQRRIETGNFLANETFRR